jgi:hypothetical protein
MKVSEKSLELNVGAELLGIMRGSWGMPKAYLRGLTQREEKQEGVDFFVQLSPTTRIFAFQFKAPKGRKEGAPYKYTLVSEQHQLLHTLALSWPESVHYVLPFYVTHDKLRRDVPNLTQDTWLLPISQMPTPEVFGGQKTKIIRCESGAAFANPKYRLQHIREIRIPPEAGVPAEEFASWYARLRHARGETSLTHKLSPWLVRGLRIAIVEAESEAV